MKRKFLHLILIAEMLLGSTRPAFADSKIELTAEQIVALLLDPEPPAHGVENFLDTVLNDPKLLAEVNALLAREPRALEAADRGFRFLQEYQAASRATFPDYLYDFAADPLESALESFERLQKLAGIRIADPLMKEDKAAAIALQDTLAHYGLSPQAGFAELKEVDPASLFFYRKRFAKLKESTDPRPFEIKEEELIKQWLIVTLNALNEARTRNLHRFFSLLKEIGGEKIVFKHLNPENKPTDRPIETYSIQDLIDSRIEFSRRTATHPAPGENISIKVVGLQSPVASHLVDGLTEAAYSPLDFILGGKQTFTGAGWTQREAKPSDSLPLVSELEELGLNTKLTLPSGEQLVVPYETMNWLLQETLPLKLFDSSQRRTLITLLFQDSQQLEGDLLAAILALGNLGNQRTMRDFSIALKKVSNSFIFSPASNRISDFYSSKVEPENTLLGIWIDGLRSHVRHWTMRDDRARKTKRETLSVNLPAKFESSLQPRARAREWLRKSPRLLRFVLGASVTASMFFGGVGALVLGVEHAEKRSKGSETSLLDHLLSGKKPFERSRLSSISATRPYRSYNKDLTDKNQLQLGTRAYFIRSRTTELRGTQLEVPPLAHLPSYAFVNSLDWHLRAVTYQQYEGTSLLDRGESQMQALEVGRKADLTIDSVLSTAKNGYHIVLPSFPGYELLGLEIQPASNSSKVITRLEVTKNIDDGTLIATSNVADFTSEKEFFFTARYRYLSDTRPTSELQAHLADLDPLTLLDLSRELKKAGFRELSIEIDHWVLKNTIQRTGKLLLTDLTNIFSRTASYENEGIEANLVTAPKENPFREESRFVQRDGRMHAQCDGGKDLLNRFFTEYFKRKPDPNYIVTAVGQRAFSYNTHTRGYQTEPGHVYTVLLAKSRTDEKVTFSLSLDGTPSGDFPLKPLAPKPRELRALPLKKEETEYVIKSQKNQESADLISEGTHQIRLENLQRARMELIRVLRETKIPKSEMAHGPIFRNALQIATIAENYSKGLIDAEKSLMAIRAIYPRLEVDSTKEVTPEEEVAEALQAIYGLELQNLEILRQSIRSRRSNTPKYFENDIVMGPSVALLRLVATTNWQPGGYLRSCEWTFRL